MKKNRGFTLVELMIVVAIIGVLAALAIFGVRKYILNSKTAEAKNSIGGIVRSAQMAYDREIMNGTVLGLGVSVSYSNRLCDTSTTVPAIGAAAIAGRKYQSDSAEWGGSQTVGWTCLKFSISDPQYFMYQYVALSSTPAAVGDNFQVIANGDLDGNGTLSIFEMDGTITASATAGSAPVIAVSPSIKETNPDE